MILTGPLGDLVCCLDESGAHDQSPIVTTGRLHCDLRRHGPSSRVGRVPFFFGVRCAVPARRGIFKNRKSPYRTLESDQAADVFSPSCLTRFVMQLSFGVTFSVRKSAYTQAKKEHGLAVNESGYGYAFRGRS